MGRLALTLLATLVVTLLAASSAWATPVFVRAFDGSATPDGSMSPGRLAVNQSTDDVYVLDEAHDAINRFDSTGVYQSQILGSVTDDRTFGFLGGLDDITVDRTSGNIYVNSEGSNKVFAFNSGGTFLWQAGGFSDACGIAVDTTGKVYVANYADGVQQLSAADGSSIGSAVAGTSNSCNIAFDRSDDLFVLQWNTGEVFNFPPPAYDTPSTIDPGGASNGGHTDIDVDRAADRLYSVHPENSDVAMYSTSGSSLGSFGSTELTGGSAFGVAVNDTANRAYVSDTGHSNVDIYDTSVVLHRLTAIKDGSGTGTVRSDDGSIDCGSTCSEDAEEGSTVTLTATADAGSRFTGWSGGGCSGTGTCRVTLNADASVTATFTARHRLTVTKAGSGTGTVTSSPSGISCGSTCNAQFDEGAVVTLTATRTGGSTFTGWSGGGCSGTSTCRVTLNADSTVTATFAASRRLTVAKNGTGSGSVASSPAGIDCGAACSGTFADGTRVTLTATPAAGSTFTGWSGGGCSGTGTCDVTLGADTTVTATFTVVIPIDRTCATDPSLCITLPPPVPGVLSLDASTATVVGGKAPVKLSCKGGTACTDTLQAIARVKVKKGRKKVTKTIVVAKGSVNIPAGGSQTVQLSLTGAGRSLLAKSSSVRTTLTGKDLRSALTIKQKPKRKKKKKKH